VERFLGNVITLFSHLAQGAAPFGGVLLADINLFVHALALIPVSVLRTAIPAGHLPVRRRSRPTARSTAIMHGVNVAVAAVSKTMSVNASVAVAGAAATISAVDAERVRDRAGRRGRGDRTVREGRRRSGSSSVDGRVQRRDRVAVRERGGRSQRRDAEIAAAFEGMNSIFATETEVVAASAASFRRVDAGRSPRRDRRSRGDRRSRDCRAMATAPIGPSIGPAIDAPSPRGGRPRQRQSAAAAISSAAAIAARASTCIDSAKLAADAATTSVSVAKIEFMPRMRRRSRRSRRWLRPPRSRTATDLAAGRGHRRCCCAAASAFSDCAIASASAACAIATRSASTALIVAAAPATATLALTLIVLDTAATATLTPCMIAVIAP